MVQSSPRPGVHPDEVRSRAPNPGTIASAPPVPDDATVLHPQASQTAQQLPSTSGDADPQAFVATPRTGVLSQPRAAEIFAGSAGLASALAAAGFDVLAVDWNRNKHASKHPVIRIDLTTPMGQSAVLSELAHQQVVYVHLAPPCGTMSRAREKPIGKWARLQVALEPRPLRSDANPEGLPHLAGLDKAKLASANELADFTARLCTLLHSRGVFFTIENPRRSHLWQLASFQTLAALPGVRRSEYDACMHGSDRDKHQSLMTNMPEEATRPIERLCDRSHAHKPWLATRERGGWTFATAQECAYHPKLCTAIVGAVTRSLASRGYTVASRPKPAKRKPQATAQDKAARAAATAAAGRQPRGTSFKQLVPECKEWTRVYLRSEAEHRLAQLIAPQPTQPTLISGVTIPAGSLVYPSPIVTGAVGGGDGEGLFVDFGIRRSPAEFVQAAIKLQHPFDAAAIAPDEVVKAVFVNLTSGTSEVLKRRAIMIGQIRLWRSELEAGERILHDRMPDRVRSVLKGKRILLLQRMLWKGDFVYPELAKDLAAGCRITGDVGVTGIFPPRESPATMSKEELWAIALCSRAALIAGMRSSGDSGLDREIYEATIAEVKAGRAMGPFTAEEVSRRLGPRWTAARRFGVVQNNKVRVVDDFSEYFVNSTVSTHERAAGGGIDVIVSLAKAWSNAEGSQWQNVRFVLSDGQVLAGRVHADFEGSRRILGKCSDLESAYKQLAVSPLDADVSVICVWNPETGGGEFFEAWAMPFGASAAVSGFNRFSAAFEWCLAHFMLVTASAYFDDFAILSPESLSTSSQEATRIFFEEIGWPIKQAKESDFSATFKALGVLFDLSLLDVRRELVCANTEGRVRELKATLEEVLKLGSLSAAQAAQLAGRLNFAKSQTFGRCGAVALGAIIRRSRQQGAMRVTSEIRWAAEWWLRFLERCKPRTVSMDSHLPPLLVWTDGAFEPDSVTPATCGAVLLDPVGDILECFGLVIDERMCEIWREGGVRQQLIGQAELLPTILAQVIFGMPQGCQSGVGALGMGVELRPSPPLFFVVPWVPVSRVFNPEG